MKYVTSVLSRFQAAHSCLQILNSLSKCSPSECLEMAEALSISILSPDEQNDYISTAGGTLQLNAVVLQSPGWWEFLGSLNPLKTLMEYLNMRHEQHKDSAYRNRLDEERKSIENRILQVELAHKTIETLRAAGVPQDQIAGIVRDYLIIPIMRLEGLQDRKLIETLEITVPAPAPALEEAEA